MRTVLFLLLLLCTLSSGAQSFGAGNIVVVRIGTGPAPMTAGMAQPVFLDEYNPCGELQRSIALPVAVSGAHRRLTLPPLATDYTEGFISRSEDGQYLALAGYDAATGTAGVTATTSASVNRTVAVIDGACTVNTTTAFSNRFNTVVVRGAVVNGTDLWVTGGNGGIVYATVGSTGTSNTLVTTLTGRCLGIYDGQLYASSTATGVRLARAGSGLPTTTGQTMQNLPGYPSSGGSPFQFFMTRLNGSDTVNVVYIADNNVLRKYSLVSGSWMDNGTIGVFTDKYRGVAGVEQDGIVTLYTVRRNDIGGEVIRYIDSTGYNANFSSLKATIIAQADSNTAFRSVAMVPQALAPLMRTANKATPVNSLQVMTNGHPGAVLAAVTTPVPVKGVVQVHDLNGRLLYTRNVITVKGINRYPLLMGASGRGVYTASFIAQQRQLLTSKFIY
ncbi:hypothetical protein [Paraflavitalea speifideaquila]|uniref:hypothetical protein n=1 Tax=Paraflavitalea speifideaquila TaxID=3076558 RepID=UPI0028EBE254|nr:hypothetical protein [Paraflavitalea speifideiaquila]